MPPLDRDELGEHISLGRRRDAVQRLVEREVEELVENQPPREPGEGLTRSPASYRSPEAVNSTSVTTPAADTVTTSTF